MYTQKVTLLWQHKVKAPRTLKGAQAYAAFKATIDELLTEKK
jgi:hypothetical protein